MSACLIILNPELSRVWHLHPEAPLPSHPAEVAGIVTWARDILGLELAVLTCLEFTKGKRGLYLCFSPDSPPSWRHLNYLAPVFRERVTLWLNQDNPLRNPWSRPAWYTQTEKRLENQLPSQGYSLTGKPRQHRTWSISAILKVPVQGETLYLKAVLPLFQHEAALIMWLQSRFPGNTPQVILAEEGWFVARDFGGVNLGDCEDYSLWQDAIAVYARLQIGTLNQEGELLALGCRDRRLPQLKEHARELASFIETLGDEKLSLDWQGILPTVDDLLEELETLGLPYCLEHGDLHCGNIQITERGFLFFDWTDGCLSHPFFSLDPFLREAPRDESIRQGLVDAYLKEWAVALPGGKLERAWHLAQKLALLHQTYSYYLINQAVEPALRGELGGAVPALARQTINALREEP